jgi:hypothetical protein
MNLKLTAAIVFVIFEIFPCNYYFDYDNDIIIVFYSKKDNTCITVSENKLSTKDTSWISWQCDFSRDSVRICGLNIGDSITNLQKYNILPDTILNFTNNKSENKIYRFMPSRNEGSNRKCLYYIYYILNDRVLLWPDYLDFYIENGIIKNIKYKKHTT